ncbi:helix-turn-helix domain-containing protein [Streptomyces avermitilis]|uniref:helix-turn-helix transcriptional regulator n=1 Tax=Streptomyces avermitilis TaxID=33903 RepID=UPI0033C7CFC4
MNPNAIRFTPERREELRIAAVNSYSEGATIAETAEKIGCSDASVRNLLREAGVALRPPVPRSSALPEGMLTTAEAAALIGVGHATFNTMQHQGVGPARAERPAGVRGNYRCYWRSDVEEWIRERSEQRLQRARRIERNKEIRQAPPAVEHSPNWDALLAAVEERRIADGLSWNSVACLSGTHPSQLSRLRNGRVKASWNTFFQLLAWLDGGMPEPVRKYLIETPAIDISS